MTTELVNGHGTTRLSIEELLDRERERNAPDDNKVQRAPAPPGIGILSRTLIPSSMTNWIVPARFLPHPNMQLLLVGENYIHLKEVTPDDRVDFRLRHRKTIPYVNDRIRAVALIGRLRVSDLWRVGSPLPSISEMMANATMPDQERGNYPIRVLAVALSSGNLQLLTPDLDSVNGDEYIKFKTKLIPLPSLGPHALAPGTQIAVDPFSRAFAVSAAFDIVVVYNNHDSRALAARITSDKDDWNPIRQERIFNVPGCIVGVEFLNPGAGSDDVVMVIISAVGRRHTLSCFTWNHKEGPDYRAVVEGRPLSLEPGSLCNMIIPMAHTPEFLLVHGSTINLFIDVLTGSPVVMNIINKKANWESEPAHPANSKRRPHFTAWSRPGRSPTHKGEFFFLIREDGAIRHYERTQDRTGPYGVVGNSGELFCHVGSAFTSFNPRRDTPDYVIASGDMSPGDFSSMGLNLRRSKAVETMSRPEQMQLVKQSSLPNWAPVLDLHVKEGNWAHGRSAIMVTSGRQPFGAISELRLGYEAQISSIAELANWDESLVGANGMWALEDSRDGSVHLICSYPDQTVALRIYMSVDGNSQESGLELKRSRLELNEYRLMLQESTIEFEEERSTIFATMTQDMVVVLVTETEITIQRLFDGGDMEVVPNLVRLPSKNHITAATSVGNLLLVATRMLSGSSSLQLCKISHDTCQLTPIGEARILESEITTLTMYRRNGDYFAIAATREPRLVLYRALKGNVSEDVLQELNTIRIDGRDLVVQSMQVLQEESHVTSSKFLAGHVLCGTRDGRLVSVCLYESAEDIRFDVSRPYQIGHGPVEVRLDRNLSDCAFVLCDSEVVYVSRPDRPGTDVHFTSIYFTDENDTSFQQKPLAALVGLLNGNVVNTDDGNATLVCHDGQNLFFATLLRENKTIPKRMPLTKYSAGMNIDMPHHDISGTPTKLLYSAKLDAYIVAGVKFEHRPRGKVPEPSWQGKRVTRGFLSIIPSNSNIALKPHDYAWNENAVLIDFAPAERVLSACEWTFKRGGRTYEYLLVGTSIQKGEPVMLDSGYKRVRTGRLWILASRSRSNGTVELELKSIKDIDQPVRALASFDETKLVMAQDGALCIYTLTPENRWSRICKKLLPSPATHITTIQHSIFVTTSRNSVLAFTLKESEGPEPELCELADFFTDDVSRNGLTHIILEVTQEISEPPMSFPTASQSQTAKEERVSKILLSSDKDGQVFGLEVPKGRTLQSAAPMAFELPLTQCVVKFAQGSVRAPWFEHETPVKGVLKDDVIGAATDGTVSHFTLLTNEARSLLKFLENLVRWNEFENQIQMLRLAQQGISGSERLLPVEGNEEDTWPLQRIVIDPDFVPGAVGERRRRDQYGVNGDLLDCFLGRNGTMHLRDMLSREETRDWREESRYVGNQKASRSMKFVELVEKLLGAGDGREEVVERCIAWLQEVMRPVL